MSNAIRNVGEFSADYDAYSFKDRDETKEPNPIKMKATLHIAVWKAGLLFISVRGDRNSCWVDNKEALRDLRDRLNALKLD